MSSILREIKKEEKKAEVSKNGKVCTLCEEAPAEFCVKGMSNLCYCRECAQEEFGSIDYLEKL